MPTNFQVGLRMTKLLPMALVKNLTIIIQPLISIAGLFLLWELAVYALSIPGYILPAPSAIWRGLAELGMTSLLGHIGATLTTVLLGFSLSVLVSLPLAIAITASPAISRVIYPLLILTQSIPKVALAPILIIMLGTNALPRVLVSFLVAFFPLVVSTAAGLLAAPPELIELGRSYRASKLKELIRIRLPFAIPFIFSGRCCRRRVCRSQSRTRLSHHYLNGIFSNARSLGCCHYSRFHGYGVLRTHRVN
jgi:NitT/TauT family transport system permease protein